MNTVPCYHTMIKISGLAEAQVWFLKKDFLSVKLVSLLYIYIYIYIYVHIDEENNVFLAKDRYLASFQYKIALMSVSATLVQFLSVFLISHKTSPFNLISLPLLQPLCQLTCPSIRTAASYLFALL